MKTFIFFLTALIAGILSQVNVPCLLDGKTGAPMCGPPKIPIKKCNLPSNFSLQTDISKDWKDFNTSMIPHLLVYTGLSAPEQGTEIQLCWSEKFFLVKFTNMDDHIYNPLTQCNQDLYNYDVNEFFIANLNTPFPPHQYHELELSPNKSALFAANVQNPNLECTGIRDTMLSCPSTNIQTISQQFDTGSDKGWLGGFQIPFSFIQNSTTFEAQRGQIFRGNFFRIDYVQKAGQWLREYQTWSPTLGDFACFHKPSVFGLLMLV